MKTLMKFIGILLCGLLLSSSAAAADSASQAKFYPAEWTDWDWGLGAHGWEGPPPAAYYSWHSERSERTCIDIDHEGCNDENSLCGIFDIPLPGIDIPWRQEPRMQDLGFDIDLIVCPDSVRKLPPELLHTLNAWLWAMYGSRHGD